ncbi:hypothetical protein FF011L_22010 [Roseimaritima multifibrata]|uniref:Uncharacterized protein n=1 Tax=Roseimaritima multifibrata TaxID=1930274 RepID=A0A517MEW5_9BACT|nr:hypothetical protein FF011L_22010 [Roseimaritima multifibrata]
MDDMETPSANPEGKWDFGRLLASGETNMVCLGFNKMNKPKEQRVEQCNALCVF